MTGGSVHPTPPEASPTGEGLTQSVLDRGRQAGLDAVGVASAEPFEDARRAIEERKAAGLHGGMAFTYRNPARSTDPALTMDGAAALVVGALRYPSTLPAVEAPGDPSATPREVSGGAVARVARYAADDHYRVLRQALGEVASLLGDLGYRAVVLADDNALVDRAAAHRAGLGWYGKNANLLLPGQGSWFVLGSVLTDAPLQPASRPAADGCGTCDRCISGCPTEAIVAPGVVDARRCLAWLLQAEGDFPLEHRAALGDRIYGCDDCQEVCPPNRRHDRAAESGRGADRAVGGGGLVDVLEMLTADDATLMECFGRWYVPRRDPRYLRRNALVVLGNLARDVSSPAARREIDEVLRFYVGCDDEMLASHARWAAATAGSGSVAGLGPRHRSDER